MPTLGRTRARIIDIWDLLLLDNAELVELGVPAEEVGRLRLTRTGHRRPLSPEWARSIGCWGGVASVEDIAEQTGKTKAQVRTWAQRWGVRARTSERQRTHAQLAAALDFERAQDSPEESRSRWGVLPIERVILLASFEEVLGQAGVTPADALDWSPAELEERWREAEVGIEAPWDWVGYAPEPPHPVAPTLSPYMQRLEAM